MDLVDEAPRRRRHPVLASFAVLICLAVAIPTLARATGREPGVIALATAFLPFAAMASLVGLLVALFSRNRAIILVAALLAAVNIFWQLPIFVADGGTAGPPALRVATVNLEYGDGDAAAVVAMVRANDIDILALEELTPDAVRRLHEAGLDALLPHSFAVPDPTFSGTGLWSRTPLRDTAQLPRFRSATLVAHTTTAVGDITLMAVHPVSPGYYEHELRDREFARLIDTVKGMQGPIVMVGDFNATRDQRPFRNLEATGMLDAADQAGAGWHPTFPHEAEGRPLVAIDHVVVRDLSVRATGIEIIDIPGSDHYGLVATYG